MQTFYESHAVSRDTRQGSLKKITALHSTGARGRVSCAVNITDMSRNWTSGVGIG